MNTRLKKNHSSISNNDDKLLDLKFAIEACKNYLNRIMDVKEILLEEVEESSDGKYWLITLSHEDKIKVEKKRSYFDKLTIPFHRSYKIIKFDKRASTIHSMKIRDI